MSKFFKLQLVAVSLAVCATGAIADEAGKNEYIKACAGCHGVSGKGDGPLADLLNIPIPDLTQLSAAAGGEFPFTETLMTIDGRKDVRAHGSNMPVWGDRYTSEASRMEASSEVPEAVRIQAFGRMLALTYYLQSIQE